MNCTVCPVRDLECHGLTHPDLCQKVAAGSAGWAAHLVTLAHHSAGVILATSTDPADLAIVRADLCQWADPNGPCGCGGPDAPPRICTRPDRPREVRRPECLECAAGPDWTNGPADDRSLADQAAADASVASS